MGGLNRDPYNRGESLGRLRRVYVLRDYRKKGIARLLCNELQEFAKKYYKGVILHTDTSEGDLFYRSLGYQKTDSYQKSSHYLIL
ncbi:GNAT family N-acetyltransferase [Bacillus sp. Marseille-Q1617]|uniref:GNAT family N-acetyltransferase n=1 Tax=Bacillus sp. Marseille-Q1617 TaxID=2736887 RepID=UPI0020CA5E23|nr:GNAT family N-acetyltransferase [Bacillus sp. Marseille-Q1617]